MQLEEFEGEAVGACELLLFALGDETNDVCDLVIGGLGDTVAEGTELFVGDLDGVGPQVIGPLIGWLEARRELALLAEGVEEIEDEDGRVVAVDEQAETDEGDGPDGDGILGVHAKLLPFFGIDDVVSGGAEDELGDLGMDEVCDAEEDAARLCVVGMEKVLGGHRAVIGSSLSGSIGDLLQLGLNGMGGVVLALVGVLIESLEEIGEEHWHVGDELALDQGVGDTLGGVEVLDGDGFVEAASDLFVGLAGGIVTDIVLAAEATEVTHNNNNNAVERGNIIVQLVDGVEESIPFFELDQGLAAAECEILWAQMEEGDRIEVVALADGVGGECVQQFICVCFDEKGADTLLHIVIRGGGRRRRSGRSTKGEDFLLERRRIRQVNRMQVAMDFEVFDGLLPDRMEGVYYDVLIIIISELAFAC